LFISLHLPSNPETDKCEASPRLPTSYHHHHHHLINIIIIIIIRKMVC